MEVAFAPQFYRRASNQIDLHGNSICINGRGVLIIGPSGSGKSQLSFELMERSQVSNCQSALISDDRSLVESRDGELFLSAPDRLQGMIEMRGLGPVPCANLFEGKDLKLDVVCSLVDDCDVPRLQTSGQTFELPELQISAPLLFLPKGNLTLAARNIEAWVQQIGAGIQTP